MATPYKEGRSTPKRHSRHASYNRLALARQSTKGPLDTEDPLAAEALPTFDINTAKPAGAYISSLSCPDLQIPERISQVPAKDFSYLQRPEIYHTLAQLDLPAAFRAPSFQPPPATPLSDLCSSSHFRSAAISAAYLLCTTPALGSSEILSLFYTRLACLTLINNTPFAAEESKALEDLSSPFYFDELTHLHLVPWELRVLAVRLQGIGYGDPRRGILGYYDLARDAREEIIKSSGEKRDMWQQRLEDLGVRAGNALVEMGDLAGAARHLENLRSKQSNSDRAQLGRLTLLYLRLGDVTAARRCIEIREDAKGARLPDETLRPLLSMAEGMYEEAISEWAELQDRFKNEAMAQNLAVCLLYAGRLAEATPLLNSLISAGQSFHALTFNLVTIYELCSEKSRVMKTALVEQVATIKERLSEERSNLDFKL